MHTLFISDLHLCAERPHISRQFFDFIGGIARDAEALFILGDLFEYWIGDDDADDTLASSVSDALRRLSADGVRVHLMHGNRDLLIGRWFAERCGASLIPDPTPIDLYGTPTLLLHGDTLCTDDLDYQNFRAYAHDPDNQAKFLALPIAARREQMLELRGRSERSKEDKSDEIMDVSPRAVEMLLREHGYPRLIHGHTHRPARHVHVVDGRQCERWVLNDWYECGGYLRCGKEGCQQAQL
jgi:UDP-2,3-diacylglucosamine hydrolase